jgi:hypothetical protein
MTNDLLIIQESGEAESPETRATKLLLKQTGKHGAADDSKKKDE